VAVSYRDGPEAAIPLVEELRRSQRLAGSHAVADVLANLYARTGAAEPSGRYLEEALASARTRHERLLIAQQVERARASYAGGSKTG
jgi:predicted RNA polymerase sigma factor